MKINNKVKLRCKLKLQNTCFDTHSLVDEKLNFKIHLDTSTARRVYMLIHNIPIFSRNNDYDD